MTSDVIELPGLDGQRSVVEEARRAIYRVRDSYQADLDKLKAQLQAGGNIIEMRACVDAAWLLSGIIRELAKAAERVEEVADDEA